MDVIERIEKGELILVLAEDYLKLNPVNEVWELAKLGKQMQWVKCSDRYPDIECYCLVYDKKRGVCCSHYDKEYADNYGGCKLPSKGFEDGEDVTYWMYMPLPPSPMEAE